LIGLGLVAGVLGIVLMLATRNNDFFLLCLVGFGVVLVGVAAPSPGRQRLVHGTGPAPQPAEPETPGPGEEDAGLPPRLVPPTAAPTPVAMPSRQVERLEAPIARHEPVPAVAAVAAPAEVAAPATAPAEASPAPAEAVPPVSVPEPPREPAARFLAPALPEPKIAAPEAAPAREQAAGEAQPEPAAADSDPPGRRLAHAWVPDLPNPGAPRSSELVRDRIAETTRLGNLVAGAAGAMEVARRLLGR
jgi:hypothetical protein